MESTSKKTSNSNTTTYSLADFFKFNSRNYLTTFYAQRPEWQKGKLSQQERERLCLIERRLSRGEYEGIEFPVVFREAPHDGGKRFRDVLDNRSIDGYLISDRMKRILEENNVTGWKTYPIVMYDKRGNEIKGYHGFSVTGRCGGEFHYLYDIKSTRCKGAYEGASIDLDQWDGSEMFMIGEKTRCSRIIITKRVYKLFKEHKIDAVEMESLPKYIHFGSQIANLT